MVVEARKADWQGFFDLEHMSQENTNSLMAFHTEVCKKKITLIREMNSRAPKHVLARLRNSSSRLLLMVV
jgi:hypothetical protein